MYVSSSVTFKVVRLRVLVESVCVESGLCVIGDSDMGECSCGQCVLIGDMDVANVICNEDGCEGDGVLCVVLWCIEVVGVAGLLWRLNRSRRVRRSCLSCCTRRQCGVAVMVGIFSGGGVGNVAGAAHSSAVVEAVGLSGVGVCDFRGSCPVAVLVVVGVVVLLSLVAELLLLLEPKCS